MIKEVFKQFGVDALYCSRKRPCSGGGYNKYCAPDCNKLRTRKITSSMYWRLYKLIITRCDNADIEEELETYEEDDTPEDQVLEVLLNIAIGGKWSESDKLRIKEILESGND